MSYANLPPSGYTIIKGALPADVCLRLAGRFAQRTVDMVFTERGFDVEDLPLEEALKLLTDPVKRREHFGDRADEAVWRNGNSRDPVHSKSCGMIHLHYDKDLLEHITLNPDLYKIAAEVHGKKELVHRAGFERICVKPRGSVDMPQHIDSNLFYPEVNYDFRIQSLVTLQIDQDPKRNTRDTGTLCLIPHFHRYWGFAARLLHPEHGLVGHRWEKPPTGRFFVLPTGKDGWDKKHFPLIRQHIKMYSDYIHRGITPIDEDVLDFYREIRGEGITIPDDPPSVLEEMQWTPIRLEPGDMVWWHQYLPHRSLRNKSKIPRIVAYYGVYPVEEGWYRSEEQRWLARQTMRLHFYYPRGGNAGAYPTDIVNKEELTNLYSFPAMMSVIKAAIKETPLSRRLAGQESWYGEDNGYVEDEDTGRRYRLRPDGTIEIVFV